MSADWGIRCVSATAAAKSWCRARNRTLQSSEFSHHFSRDNSGDTNLNCPKIYFHYNTVFQILYHFCSKVVNSYNFFAFSLSKKIVCFIIKWRNLWRLSSSGQDLGLWFRYAWVRIPSGAPFKPIKFSSI